MVGGDFIWLLLIGGFVYRMMRGGGGCRGDHNHDSHGGIPSAGNTAAGGCCGAGLYGNQDPVGNDDYHQNEGLLGRLGGKPKNDLSSPPPLPVAKDPVCGMEVSTITSGYVSEYHSEQHYFCSEKCKKLFDIHPVKYPVRGDRRKVEEHNP